MIGRLLLTKQGLVRDSVGRFQHPRRSQEAAQWHILDAAAVIEAISAASFGFGFPPCNVK